MSDFKVGDKVWLNSGSPTLTVTSMSESTGKTTVTWLAGQFSEPQSMMLPKECFTTIETPLKVL
jgi:uncharacterized protein YodC (DUF2158 family)